MFEAIFFDGRSSRAYPVRVTVEADNLKVQGETLSFSYPVSACRVEPALGRSARLLKFPDGALLETTDVEAVARFEDTFGLNKTMRLVHRLESAWKFVALSAAALVAVVWVFTVYGLPVLARQAAYATPLAVTTGISERTLTLLDDAYLTPSTISVTRQGELREAFERLAAGMSGLDGYRLEFRGGGRLGANAFALPSGIIVITDDLIALSERDEEILAVLAHEVGHVEKRHGLRSVYQRTGVFLLLSVLLGDVTSATSVAASLPAVLVDSGYSRTFEREADRVAGGYFLAQGSSTQALQDILSRLDAEHGTATVSFLSSHPGTSERIERLKQLEADFRQ